MNNEKTINGATVADESAANGKLQKPSTVQDADVRTNIDVKIEGQQEEDDGMALRESFDEMNLKESLLRGIYLYGYEKPSRIQQKAIVPFSSGRDLIAQAQSGTGKTAAYIIGMLQQLDFSKRYCQGLVMVPTRELAVQVFEFATAVGDLLGLVCHACIGGTRVSEDFAALRRGVHVVVGTPGRVFDMMKRGALQTDSLKVIVLDEADEMLSQGFEDVLRSILQLVPTNAQVGVFSATMPKEIQQITERILKDPTKIYVKAEELTLEGIKQFYINLGDEDFKFETLCDLFNEISVAMSVIFCSSRRKVDWLAAKMKEEGFPVGSTHGDKGSERQAIMQDFRHGTIRMLICTDLLARGIDVHQVSVVINYDMPRDRETYLHRIGRGGRFGKKGVAINLLTKNDYGFVKELEKFYDTHIEELPKNISALMC